MAFLERFDAELLLGQVSYKQKSDIYNFYKYEKTQKKSQNKATPASDSDDDDCRYVSIVVHLMLASSRGCNARGGLVIVVCAC